VILGSVGCRTKLLYTADIDEALANLFRFSLAKRKNNLESFWIHPLVHVWARERLQKQKANKMSEIAVHLVTNLLYFETDAERTSKHELQQTEYLSHVSVGCLHAKTMLSESSWSSRGINAAYTLARVAYHFNQIDTTMLLMDFFISADSTATTSASVCRAFLFQARGLRDQCKYKESEEKCNQALSIAQQAFGYEHSETMTIMREMALILYFQDKIDNSLDWYEVTMKKQERVLGKDNPETLHTVSHAAMVLARLGRLDEAIAYYERALKGQVQHNGEYHSRTLLSIHGLAEAHSYAGNIPAALKYFERAFKGRREMVGADHPSTLYSQNGLAKCYAAQGENENALRTFKEVLKRREKTHGRGGLQTLYTVTDMAYVYENQGELGEALSLHERATAARNTLLGPAHFHTLTSVHAKATILAKLDRRSEATNILALAVREPDVIDGNSLVTLSIKKDLGALYCEEGKLAEGRKLLREAWIGREHMLGPTADLTLQVGNLLKKYELVELNATELPTAEIGASRETTARLEAQLCAAE
jgi:tetratricopeptide (TPR) repeat protein